MLLYLCPVEIQRKKMSRVRFHAIDAISKVMNVKQYFPEKDEDIKTVVDTYKPKYVFWYKPCDLKNFLYVASNKNIIKIISYNEMYNRQKTIKEILTSRSNLIICHHNNDYDWYVKNYDLYFNTCNYNSRRVVFVNIPHSANENIFKDYGLKKEWDVLLVGRATPKHYPFRVRLLNIVENRLSKICKTKVWEHPGYNLDIKNHDDILVEYAKAINKSKITLSCSSKYFYLLGKMTEIPACRSLLCSDLPDDRNDIFSQFTLEINDSMSDDKIVEKIKSMLNNDSKLKEMTDLGKAIIDEKFQFVHYAAKFKKIIGSIYG